MAGAAAAEGGVVCAGSRTGENASKKRAEMRPAQNRRKQSTGSILLKSRETKRAGSSGGKVYMGTECARH
jgi:hypothetical protein